MANKKKPLEKWVLDVGFYSYQIHVKARSRKEARAKAIAKLQKVPVTKYLNRNTTSLDKW